MVTGKRKYLTNWIFFIAALLVALICREINEDRTLLEGTLLGATQTLIYTGLVLFWSVSVHHRIVQPQIRRLLKCISVLIVFWFLTRGIKYYVLTFFDGVENVQRYLWYLYYIPMNFMPTIMMMTAFSLRKPENYHLPKRAVITMLSVSLALLLCVLTNDLHQLVFYFPENAVVFNDSEYGYGFLYYLCLGWMAGCALTTLIAMLMKCRLRGSKMALLRPFVPIALCIAYSIAYITDNVAFFDDISIVNSFLLIATLELCIVVGLIPSNMHYESLFQASEISAIITDEILRPIYASNAAVLHDRSMLRKAVENSSLTENGMRLSAYPISGGYSFLEEDVSELYETIEELEEVRAELKEEYMVAQEVYQTSRKRQSLVEKNSLYNTMQSETKAKTESLCALLNKLSQTDDQSEMRSLAAELALYFAFLKRRNNLLFLRESGDRIRGDELVFCIRESLDNFRLRGAEANLNAALHRDMSFRNVTRMYDAFETALEAAQKETRELFVALTQSGDSVIMHMDFVCTADLSHLSAVGFAVSDEGDDEWILKYTVQEGGAPV